MALYGLQAASEKCLLLTPFATTAMAAESWTGEPRTRSRARPSEIRRTPCSVHNNDAPPASERSLDSDDAKFIHAKPKELSGVGESDDDVVLRSDPRSG